MGTADTGSAWLCFSAPEIGFSFFVCILFACLFWLMLIVRAGCSSEGHGYAHNTLNSYIVKWMKEDERRDTAIKNMNQSHGFYCYPKILVANV